MYEISFIFDKVLKKIAVKANDLIQAKDIFQSMFYGFGIEIIDIRRL